MYRLGVFLLPLVVVFWPTNQASAQFNIANLFSGVGGNSNGLYSGVGQNTNALPSANVPTPKVDTSNRRVGGSMLLNTSNATKNLMSVFNTNTSSTQLMGNRTSGYSIFPKEKDMPGTGYLTTYFHYKRPTPNN